MCITKKLRKASPAVGLGCHIADCNTEIILRLIISFYFCVRPQLSPCLPITVQKTKKGVLFPNVCIH
jgi:hypothetical protein